MEICTIYSHQLNFNKVVEIVKMTQPKAKIQFKDGGKQKSLPAIIKLDEIYRMNWACIDARIKGEAVGGNINPSVIYERHYSLNWLTNYQNQDWDDVNTNT